MEETLDCPICGAQPVPESEMLLGSEYWRIKCPHCFCRTFLEPTLEDAVHEWNRRVY
jgi:hypothetical protein